MVTTCCSKRSDWFCLLCACYVYIKNRIQLSENVRKRIVQAYDRMPENLGRVFAPRIICRTCHNDLQRHINQGKPLRYNKPAVWNRPQPDHSNCFMCCFTVHKYNRIAKRLFGYASDTNLELPVTNPNFNDKLNNLSTVKNSKLQELLRAGQRDEDPEADIAVSQLLNDLVDCVVESREYANSRTSADSSSLRKVDLPIAFNLFKRANVPELKSQLQSKMNPIYLQSSQTLNSRPTNGVKKIDDKNGQSTSNQTNSLAISKATNQIHQATNQMTNQTTNHANPSTCKPNQTTNQANDQTNVNNKRKMPDEDSDDEDIAFVGEVKRRQDELVSTRSAYPPVNAVQPALSWPSQKMIHTINCSPTTSGMTSHSATSSPTTSGMVNNDANSSSSTSRMMPNRTGPVRSFNKPEKVNREPKNRRAPTMYHDVEVRRHHVNQISVDPDESLTAEERKLFDLSAGMHAGSFRVEQNIELKTYFGKKFKQNRQVQKTSRNEFDDLISMLDISESSAQVLETFFERKNYFLWF